MRVLLTGSTSFTGHHFATSLLKTGWEVFLTLTRPIHLYDDLKLKRLENLKKYENCNFIVSSFGSDAFNEIISKLKPDVVCLHGAYVENYKSDSFDVSLAIANNCQNTYKTFQIFKEVGVSSIIYTGSVFEANEGVGSNPNKHFSAYGLSKSLTSQIFQFYSNLFDIKFGKFVIPNPFGVLEEKRFVYYLVSNWFAGKTPTVGTPLYIRDNIPVDLLSLYYIHFLNQVFESDTPFVYKLSPTGFKESNLDFANHISREFSSRLGKSFNVDFTDQSDFKEPIYRTNFDYSKEMQLSKWNENIFWDSYVSYYSRLFGI